MDPIRTESLTYRYGSRRGIEGVSLRVSQGSLFGFLGPNGAGKSTTIRVLLGFLRPTAGAASAFGMDCWRDSPRIKRDVGYIPGDIRLWPWISGELALRLFGSVRGRDLMPAGRKLGEMFELDLTVRVRRMSRGMRQKLGLVLAMAHEPKLLVLDEPSTGLDPLMQDRLLDHLKSLAVRGTTIFFSSHTLSEVERLCDRLAIVREGRIVFDGALADLQRRAGHVVTVRWRAGAPTPSTVPIGLSMTARDAGAWTGHWDGPVEDLLRWVAAQPVEDISITRPDLDSLFRQYYQSTEAPR